MLLTNVKAPGPLVFKWEGKAERGMIQANLKNIRQSGHMGGFNKYLFKGLFHLTQ